MPALSVVIYTKTHCSLCEDAVAAVERLQQRLPFELRVVDITTLAQAELLRYRYEIPVVFVNGQEAFRHRVDERVLEQLLRDGTAVAELLPEAKARST